MTTTKAARTSADLLNSIFTKNLKGLVTSLKGLGILGKYRVGLMIFGRYRVGWKTLSLGGPIALGTASTPEWDQLVRSVVYMPGIIKHLPLTPAVATLDTAWAAALVSAVIACVTVPRAFTA